MSRLKRFVRQQRRAWAMLLGPEPKPFVWPEVTGHEHPIELCRCAGAPVSQNTAAHAVDHLPDCRWLAAACKACGGSGHCPTCDGDGVAMESP